MSIKEKLHKFLFPAQSELMSIKDLEILLLKETNSIPLKEKDLERLFTENKEFFYRLCIKEMTGDIPQTVQEPALRIFNEQSEDIERWVLWQSYQMRRRVQLTPADPLKIEFFDGIQYFLKIFLEMSHTQRITKTLKPSTQTVGTTAPVEKPLEDVEAFMKGMKKKPLNPEVEDGVVIPSESEQTMVQ